MLSELGVHISPDRKASWGLKVQDSALGMDQEAHLFRHGLRRVRWSRFTL